MRVAVPQLRRLIVDVRTTRGGDGADAEVTAERFASYRWRCVTLPAAPAPRS